jgi:uncharacterized protein (DUF433 family)
LPFARRSDTILIRQESGLVGGRQRCWREEIVMAGTMRDHIEVTPGAGGPEPRIAGHRIRVRDVVIWHEKLGMSPDAIVDQYPTITLADVHAALAYYWDHRDEIEQAIAAERALAEELRRQFVSPVQEKLARRGRG